jgi:DNA-binding NarL/FixJ family response regulator
MQRGGSIQILIADDSEVVRSAVKSLLNDQSTWQVCGEVDNGADALNEVANRPPDTILLDLSIPALDGLTVAQKIRKDHPSVKVVLMSAQEISVLSRLAEVAGTSHYIEKSRLASDLIPLLKSLS